MKRISDKKQDKYFLSIVLGVGIVAALFAALFAPIYDKNNYLEGKQVIESISFDDLQTSMVIDGTEIVAIPSVEYPKDKIVTYKSVRFPVENHEGKSVVVATYSHDDGK